jgi:hypothetical protein
MNGFSSPNLQQFSERIWSSSGNSCWSPCVGCAIQLIEEAVMGFGRGALLWLIGIPIPIILLLAIFMHH